MGAHEPACRVGVRQVNETVVTVWCETPINGKCSKPELMQVLRTGALPLNPSFLHYATAAGFMTKPPSHELIAALMLLHVCKRVDAYGLREQLHSSLDPSKRCLSELVKGGYLQDQLAPRTLAAHTLMHKVRALGLMTVEASRSIGKQGVRVLDEQRAREQSVCIREGGLCAYGTR